MNSATRRAFAAGNVARFAVLAAASLTLGACVSLGSKAPAQLISLSAESPAPVGAIGQGKLSDAVVILDPTTDRRLDVQRVAVQVDDVNVAYLKDAAWVERPARQFRQLLAEVIRAKGKRLVLEENDELIGAKLVLSSRLNDMGYDARSQSVIVRLDAVRQQADGTMISQRFESRISGIPPKNELIAPALNRAANDVARQVADWVN